MTRPPQALHAGAVAPSRILLPLLEGTNPESLLPLVAALAGPDGHVVLLAVVTVGHGHDLLQATAAARAARTHLRRLARGLPRTVTSEALVRAAASVPLGVRQVAGETPVLLVLPLPAAEPMAALSREPYRGLVEVPAANTVLASPGRFSGIRQVLVSARGGPHAELALDVALRVGRSEGAGITVLHVAVPGAFPAERQHEQALFQALVAGATATARIRSAIVPADSVTDTIVAQARRHDLVVTGARAGPLGNPDVGAVPARVVEQSPVPVLIVKSQAPVSPAVFRPATVNVDETVNGWFIENTLSCRDYAGVDELAGEKRRRGLTLGVAILAGESTDTLAGYARVIDGELRAGSGLVDRTVFFCAGDEAALAAQRAGLECERIDSGAADERGRLMYASLRRLNTDIVVWLDADTRNVHPKQVYGLAGPLIMQERLLGVKGFFGLPREAPDADLRTLAGEFAARPLINLHFPELSGIIDPLGVELAVRQSVARQLPVFSGPAAQLGVLLDLTRRYGLSTLAQVALEERVARPLDLDSAGRLAFSAAQLLDLRAGGRSQAQGPAAAPPTIKVIHSVEQRFRIILSEARELELQP